MSSSTGGALPYAGDPVKMRQIFEQLGCGIYTVDPDGLITGINDEAAALLGYDGNGLIGRHAHHVLHARRPDGSPYPVEQCPLMGVLRHRRRAEAAADAFLSVDGAPVPVSWISTPLATDGRLDGAVVLFRSVADAQRVEQERTHALEAERRQRLQMQAAHERLRLLSEIAQALSSTLDPGEALVRLTGLVVPRLATGCVISTLDEDGRLHQVAVTHHDRGMLAPGEYEGLLPWPVASAAPLARVLSGAGAVRASLGDHAPFPGDALAEVQWRLLRGLGGEHVLITPLSARGRVLGSLTLLGDDAFDDDDLSLVEDIGRRAGLALDNARLHAGQRDVAETLQRSLLTELPQVGHVDLAARYQPAGTHSRVGGDWYDAFVAAEGRTTIVIGDIAGHDVEAAARMGQVRNLLRGIAVDRSDPPSEVVRRLDRAVRLLGAAEYATLLVGEVRLLDQERGLCELRFTNAGHPPPLLVHADGRAQLLGGEPDLPLGVLPEAARSDVVIALPPGCTLLLYTDGLVEHRQESLTSGLARLRNAASRNAGEDIEQFCDSLLDELHAMDSADDIALLALRVPPTARGTIVA